MNKVIYDILSRFGNNYNDPQFHEEVRKQLEGKFFIMRYSNQSIKIAQVDFGEDENGTFEMGEHKVVISYKDYVRQQYSITAKDKEICVLRDFRGNAYLPQFAYLTLRSDECADVYEQILQVTNAPIEDRLDRVCCVVSFMDGDKFDFFSCVFHIILIGFCNFGIL